jgi:hypothetical protein
LDLGGKAHQCYGALLIPPAAELADDQSDEYADEYYEGEGSESDQPDDGMDGTERGA